MPASIGYGLRLAGLVLEALGWFWFITLPLLLFAAVAWMRVPDGEPRRFRAGWIVMAVQGGAASLLLALGTVCARPKGGEPLAGAEFARFAILVAAFVALVMLVDRGKGRRFLVFGTGLLGFWIVLFTAIVAGMSVTGDWDWI